MFKTLALIHHALECKADNNKYMTHSYGGDIIQTELTENTKHFEKKIKILCIILSLHLLKISSQCGGS